MSSASKEREARHARITARQHALDEAREQGREYLRAQPELLLIEVCRHAAGVYRDGPLELQFLQGYIEARQQRDEYQRERRERR